MVNLETKVPVVVTGPEVNHDMIHAEKQLLRSYMSTAPESVYDCQTCNNCGSGDCSSCCSS